MQYHSYTNNLVWHATRELTNMYSHSAASYERLLLYVVMYNNNVPLMCNIVGSCQVMMMGTPKYGCDHILTQ